MPAPRSSKLPISPIQIDGRTPSIGKPQEILEGRASAVGPDDLSPHLPSSTMDVNHPAPKAPEHPTNKHRKETNSTPEEETLGQETRPQAGRRTQTILQEPMGQAVNSPDTSLRNKIHPASPPSPTTDNRQEELKPQKKENHLFKLTMSRIADLHPPANPSLAERRRQRGRPRPR